MENKTGKYFKYAIGEITLVVIGILIALQINNWNTNNLDHKKEIGILTELKEGLKADKKLLQVNLQAYEKDFIELNRLDSLLKIKSHPYSKSMNTLFGKVYGIRYVRINNAFYEDLKSSGLQLVKDKNIRSKIVNLFENNYKILTGILENEQSANHVIRPYYLENFTELDFTASANPIDYAKIWSDPYYKNIVHYRIITLKSNQINAYKKTLDAIELIIDAIEKTKQ